MSEEEKPDAEAVDAPAIDDAVAEMPLEELHLLLEDARNKADDHWDQLLRARAELDNLRRRSERELENAHKYALDRFVEALLPVRDSMEMGLEAARGEADLGKIREGNELTLQLLEEAMNRFGVARIDPLGEPFDPEQHQAMSIVETSEVQPDHVVNVYQRGYSLNERLIRPAMVVVAKSPQSGSIDEQA